MQISQNLLADRLHYKTTAVPKCAGVKKKTDQENYQGPCAKDIYHAFCCSFPLLFLRFKIIFQETIWHNCV